MNSELASDFSSKFYTETSLQEDVEACETERNPKLEIYANLVVKYFYAYFYPESVGKVLERAELERLMRTFAEHKKVGDSDRFDLGEKFVFTHSQYQLTMLGDIAKSVEILRDIIERSITVDQRFNSFVGIDVGTGTGILLLAQKILSARAGVLDRIRFIGVESKPRPAQLSGEVLSALELDVSVVGRRVQNRESLASIKSSEGVFAFTNENIPSSSNYLGGEPYVDALKALFAVADKDQTRNTEFFPEFLEYETAEKMGIIENTRSSVAATSGLALGKVFPRSIPILGEKTDLGMVGDRVYERGLLSKTNSLGLLRWSN